MTRGHWVAFLLVLAVAAPGSAILAARLAARHARGHDHTHSEASEKDFHAFLHARLQPTPEQALLLDPLEHRYEEERLRLRGAIESASKDLAAAIRDGRRDSVDVGSALARLHGLQGELQRITLDHFFEMKEHLDPTQAALLLELTHDSILNRHDH